MADGWCLARYVALVFAAAPLCVAHAAPDSRSEEHALGSVPAGVEVERGIEFSCDGARVAFVGTKDGKPVPVIDGKAFEPGWFVHPPRFSADGRVAFRVVEEPKKRKHVSWILLDGKRLPDSDGVDLLAWSPDGRRLAFTRFPECKIAEDRSREGDCVLVVDGKKGGARSAILFVQWSADSKRVAEVAEETSKKPLVVNSVFVDGKSIASGSVYDGPVFSPDGTRVAYTAQLQKKDEPNPPPERIKWFVACGDQRLGLDFDAAGSPAFSPDGKRIAFKAEKAGRVGISVDGAAPAGDWLFVTTPVWSGDGAHLAFVASADCTAVPGYRVTQFGERLVKDGTRQAVLDGKPVGEKAAAIDGLTFSSDGKLLARRAGDGKKWRIVCGAKKSADYDFVGTPQFLDGPGPGRVAFGVLAGRDFAWKVMAVE